MRMLSIRPADIDDAREIADIQIRSLQHAYRDILPKAGLQAISLDERVAHWSGWLQPFAHEMHILVAEERAQVIGFCSWGPNTDTDAEHDSVMLYSIYVDPNATARGVGSALLAEARAGMISSGARTAVLHVLVENTSARNFYEHRDWIAVPGSESVEHFFGMEMRTMLYRTTLI